MRANSRSFSPALPPAASSACTSTVSADAEAFYALLSAAGTENEDLARTLETTIKALLVVDWTFKEDVQREMRKQVKRELRTAGTDPSQLEALTAGVLDVARARLA
ncbi:MAG: type I restriction enzyme endonuclease domain-containing protein [Deinococcus sp.]